MPVLNEFEFEISLADLRQLRTLHSKKGLNSGIRALLPEVLAEVEERALLRPAIAWESRRVLEVSGSRVRLAGGSELAQAEAVVELLGDAEELVMVVGSIGPALDLLSRDWFANGRELEAFVLSEVGNLAVGKLNDCIPQSIADWAVGRGLETSGALSPGGTGIDLSEQRVVVELASAERIGVELTSTCMLTPLKSISMVIGLGHGLPKWSHAQACELCASRDRCRLRRVDSETAVA